MKIKSITGVIALTMGLISVTGCKKGDNPATITYTVYKGETQKGIITPTTSPPPQSFPGSTVSTKTSGNNDIEISFSIDPSITYKGKYIIQASSATIISNTESAQKSITVSIMILPNNQTHISYGIRDKSNNSTEYYNFFGEKI